MKFLLVLCLSFFILQAQDENSSVEAPSFIDTTHASFSSHVKSWGASIDDMVLGIYDYFNIEGEAELNPFLQESNSSQHIDENLTWVVPIRVHTDDNNSVVLLKDVNDKNTSRSRELFPLSQETKNLRVEEAQSKFFVYECMRTDTDEKADEDKAYTDIQLPKINKKTKNEENSIDAFFLTRKLLEERNRSYIRVSFLQPIQSLGEEAFRFNVKARVHLTRSRKRLKLFIENFNDDSAKNIGKADEKDNPSIGLEQESKTIFGIRPRYSIGFRGIDPFVRARYTFETDLGRWHFKPVQTFQYSLDDEFSEITELFLDTPTSERTLLRFVIDRGSNTIDPGMHYDGFIQWFFKPRKKAGLSLNLGANGSTKYENTITTNPDVTQQENRVFNYLFLARWRENILKEWLFYEVGPGLNYHEQYDYRPNYTIYFGIDMFFGHI